MIWNLKVFRRYRLFWMDDDRAELINKWICRNLLMFSCRMWKFFRFSANCCKYFKGELHEIKFTRIPICGPHNYSNSCSNELGFEYEIKYFFYVSSLVLVNHLSEEMWCTAFGCLYFNMIFLHQRHIRNLVFEDCFLNKEAAKDYLTEANALSLYLLLNYLWFRRC